MKSLHTTYQLGSATDHIVSYLPLSHIAAQVSVCVSVGVLGMCGCGYICVCGIYLHCSYCGEAEGPLVFNACRYILFSSPLPPPQVADIYLPIVCAATVSFAQPDALKVCSTAGMPSKSFKLH